VTRRPLALTLGDPAGIGPEIVVKAWRLLRETGPAFVVVGDHDALAAAPGAGDTALQRIARFGEAAAIFGETLPVLDLPLKSQVVAGRPDASSIRLINSRS